MGLVSWMYMHRRVDVHSGTRIQYHSLQTLSLFKKACDSRLYRGNPNRMHI
ncbi:unnamed protein product [Schistosoma mattheei]|uniref:Uncharacterized protein n=1 Tax=Schistosoma mattheei TaxID=31246 RepID=A0A3P8F133_9TREM|nr:unnamed protein product [Schistosoma mattheei]